MEVGSHGKWHRRALLLAAMQWHHKVVLDAGAKAIAKIEGYDFAGHYESGRDYSDPLFFVPGDTLLVDEASCLGIRSPNDLYGGVVPHLFAKTKAITHGLVDCHAERPPGWSTVFAERVRGVVLPGYTVFSSRDARVAARRMLRRGPLRLKKPLSASGRDQTLVTSLNELDAGLENITADEIATYGLVLEENLRQVRTLSIGEVAIGSLRISYHGTQRTVRDNEGRPVYGGSDLVCVRGGWKSLDALPMPFEVRAAVAAARQYDVAAEEFSGFIASRRNYDVAQGIGADDWPQSGVLEPSWRVGGASSAELASFAAFARDPSLEIVGASHVEEFGTGRRAKSNCGRLGKLAFADNPRLKRTNRCGSIAWRPLRIGCDWEPSDGRQSSQRRACPRLDLNAWPRRPRVGTAAGTHS